LSNLSDLGTFQLGQAQLGASLGSIHAQDFFSFSDALTLDSDVSLQDLLSIGEQLGYSLFIELADAFSFAEGGFYPTEGWAGVLGKIVLRMDVTSEDFCAMVDESGMSIEINDQPARAFCFIKQRGQKFEQGIEIYPGDAVMFSCPEDAIVLQVGDEIKFSGYIFTVEHIIDEYFDGNIIYRKSALRKIRSIPDMPQVQNLIASPNLEGKTTLTWDEIDLDVWAWFSHYEVHESTDDITYFLREATKQNSINIKNIVENTAYYYKVRAVDKYARTGAFSVKTVTPTDTTPPSPPSGVR